MNTITKKDLTIVQLTDFLVWQLFTHHDIFLCCFMFLISFYDNDVNS